MDNNTLKIILRVIGVLYIFFGIFALCLSIVILGATGFVGYAESVANSAGETLGTYPTAYALGGSVVIGLMAIMYFVAAFSLITLKKWAYIAVAMLGALGLVSGVYSIIAGTISFTDFVFGLAYLGLAAFLFTKKDSLLK